MSGAPAWAFGAVVIHDRQAEGVENCDGHCHKNKA